MMSSAPVSSVQSLHQQVPIDDMRRIQSQSQSVQHRSYDEFDSDDELRREEISFTIDGGASHSHRKAEFVAIY